MAWNRRRFLKRGALATAATSAVGGVWLSQSQSWAARFLRERIRETRRAVLAAPHRPVPGEWKENAMTIAWLGHATVLINFYGVNILTDPVFGARVGLDVRAGVLGPKRFVACALPPRELPPIDVLLLSHAHLDHIDLPSLNRLKPAFSVTARETADVIAGTPARGAKELRWGERIVYRGPKGELEIQAIEVKHWGARWRKDRHRGYAGYILSREGRKILFGGDTANTPLFRELRSHGPFEAAVMPIGAYRPWIHSHCTPEQAVEMANAAGARHLVPIHHSTFKLSEEPMSEPIERMEAALHHEPGRLALRKIGETCVVG